MSYFHDLEIVRSQEHWDRKPKENTCIRRRRGSLSLSYNSKQHARNFFVRFLQGYCERKKPKS